MKFVAVFLACIVAAQGATYQIPSYHYWCSHAFHVLPAHGYYSYRIHFNRSWCTAAYYRHILAEFPTQHYPKGCESEDNADARVKELEEKLAHSRAEIERELFLPLTAWKKALCEMNADYARVFREYYTKAYHHTREEVEQKALAYARELEVHKERAVHNFIGAVRAIVRRIESFHRQLVSQFKSCLATRKTKIGLFVTKLDAHATKLIKQYEINLENLCLNKVAFVKKIFTSLYHGKEKPADLEQALVFYEGSIRKHHVELFQEFERRMLEAVRLIKDSYRCDYVCYIKSGCYSFARRRHTRSCVRMPCLPRTMCKMYTVKPFNLDWRGPHFKTLRTCTKAERECVWEHQPHLDEISRKYTIYTQELVLKRTSWIQQVNDWKVKAMKALEAIIALKMPKYYNGCPPTQEQIVSFHDLLKQQAKAWVDLHHDKMMAQIEAIYHKVHARIETWKSCADAHVMKIRRSFDACVAAKKTKIAHYTTCLVDKRVAQRARIEKKLRECARVHLLKFDKFFASAFGADPANDLVKALKEHYHACVHEKVETTLRKFDDFQLVWEPRLIMHYCCGLKCRVRFTPPCMKLPLNWNFCPPSVHKCVFHC